MSEFEQEWCSVIGVFNQRPAQTKSSQQIIILNIFSIFLQSSQQIKVLKKNHSFFESCSKSNLFEQFPSQGSLGQINCYNGRAKKIEFCPKV